MRAGIPTARRPSLVISMCRVQTKTHKQPRRNAVTVHNTLEHMNCYRPCTLSVGLVDPILPPKVVATIRMELPVHDA